MRSKIAVGATCGLGAGLVFGVMMQVMNAPTPDSSQMPMMAMVASVVRSDSIVVGWIYHLFNSAMIGAIFGWLLGGRVRDLGGALGWGALYSVLWWVLGGLILMPLFLGMPAFAPIMMPMMRPVAMGSLVGHLVYGLVLGGLYARLYQPSTEMSSDLRSRPAGGRG